MNLDLKVTESARKEILRYIAGLSREISLPALMKGSTNEQREEWRIRGYTEAQAADIERVLFEKGIEIKIRYQIGDISLFFPQPQLVNEVMGKTLDFRGSVWVVE